MISSSGHVTEDITLPIDNSMQHINETIKKLLDENEGLKKRIDKLQEDIKQIDNYLHYPDKPSSDKTKCLICNGTGRNGLVVPIPC
jgi:peptidoglycan hydrolase CwlO-like protein